MMEKIIEKADVLLEALPYIKKFYGKKIVIKFGGSAMSEEANISRVIEDIIFMRYVGMKPIVIHGGGPAISNAMRQKGLLPKFVEGLRVTDRETMDIVEDVLINKINKDIVQMLNDKDKCGEGLSGKDENFLLVEKYMPSKKDSVPGNVEKIDIGFVGEVKEINSKPVEKILKKGHIPIIAPIGIGEDGCSYNINGDVVAGEIAAALGAEKLVFLTDVQGIMKNPKDADSLISTLNSQDIENLIAEGTIDGGMIPKVTSCVKALSRGVGKAHIIDGKTKHSLLLEMFTVKGIGTEIIK